MASPIRTIFLVDDSEDEAYLTTEFFRRERVGPALVHAYNYDELRQKLDDDPHFDPERSIFALDLNLRSSRGPELIGPLREDFAEHDLIIGICTGSQDPADQKGSFDAGADFYIEKPLNRRALEQISFVDDRLTATSEPDETLGIDRLH